MKKHSRVQFGSNMSVKIICFTLVLSLGTIFMTLPDSQAEDNNWYVGEGVKKDMYVKYLVGYFDTNNGRPFEITIYFKDLDDKGNWIAPVYVQDQGKVLQGTFRLSPLDLTALGTSEIPPEMGKYRSAYANSLQWLAAYVPKPGLSLNAGSWGKIGSIGGSEIKPVGSQQLTIAAFSQPIDTTRVEYYKSVSSNIYIKNEFPYPVMAKTFVDVTTGTPPVQFEFILEETGTGQPPIPESATFEATPPLLERTERGQYYVQLDWNPVPIFSGNETTFTLDFLDKDHFPLSKVSYNLKLTGSNNTSIADLKNQFAPDGTKAHKFTFEKPTLVNVEVTINSVRGVDTGAFVEKTDFTVNVN